MDHGHGDSRSPRASSAQGSMGHMQRRPAQTNRSVEGVTLPVPIRVPSRLGQSSSLPGSGSGTPRMGTPRMGTPRMGTPRHSQNRVKRRKALFAMQIIVAICFVFLGVKQLATIMKHSAQIDDSWVPPQVPGGEDSVIHSPTAEEVYEDGDEEEINVRDIINLKRVHGGISDDQKSKLQLLADALLAENDDAEITLFPKDSLTSGLYAHPTTGGTTDSKPNHFYRFTNVKLEHGRVVFYGGTEMKQPKSMWYDVTTANSTVPKAPTTLLVRTKRKEFRQFIDVEYVAEQRPPNACSSWIEEPAFLTHSRYPENMWHAWTDGLLGTFQTARELGYLDLFKIDQEGVTTKLGTGLSGDECPIVADLLTGSVKPASDCVNRKKGSSFRKRCNVEDTCCQPGVWPGNPELKFKKEGPAIIYSDESVVSTEWSALYSAMSSKVRSLDAIDGSCLRNLIVGSTKSFSFEEAIEGVDDSELGAFDSLSSDLDDFVQFTRSAQQRLVMNNAIEFLGYPDLNAEKLRKGIHLGQGGLIDRVYPSIPKTVWDSPYVWGLDKTMQDDKMAMIHHPWVFAYQKRHKTLKSEYDRVKEEARKYLSPPPIPFENHGWRQELPVVTFITRVKNLNRAILNERHVLRYIYWNYEVRLRVTDLSEHVDAVASIFSETDVLIGSHEPGWMHSIFLKSGAVTLQLLPYGWRNEDDSLFRGGDVQNTVHLRRGSHLDWVNPHAEFSFFRRKDFKDGGFVMHPSSEEGSAWSRPDPENIHPAWLYANTYADMNHLGAFIDVAMEAAGIPKLPGWKIDELKAIRQQTRDQMPERMRQDWLEGNLAAAGWEEDDTVDEEDDGIETEDSQDKQEEEEEEEDEEEEDVNEIGEYDSEKKQLKRHTF
ncbi:hypothetical protein PSENEW3_00001599 [Picochlorum sp. SENEW3]|nr:hypothetical protein PSENEW3_00001599 [Picochlorum sp. SENEW3]